MRNPRLLLIAVLASTAGTGCTMSLRAHAGVEHVGGEIVPIAGLAVGGGFDRGHHAVLASTGAVGTRDTIPMGIDGSLDYVHLPRRGPAVRAGLEQSFTYPLSTTWVRAAALWIVRDGRSADPVAGGDGGFFGAGVVALGLEGAVGRAVDREDDGMIVDEAMVSRAELTLELFGLMDP